jgi:hypothetical protein
MRLEAAPPGQTKENSAAAPDIQECPARGVPPGAALEETNMVEGDELAIGALQTADGATHSGSGLDGVRTPVLIGVETGKLRLAGKRMLKDAMTGRTAQQLKVASSDAEEPVTSQGVIGRIGCVADRAAWRSVFGWCGAAVVSPAR